MRTAPCKGCEERHAACWSKCEEYLAWKSEKDSLTATQYADRQAEMACADVIASGKRKTARGKHKR